MSFAGVVTPNHYKMESPFDDVTEAIIILDLNNQIIGANLAGEQLLALKRTDLIGKSVDTMLSQGATSENRTEILKDGRKTLNLSRGDGKTFYAELMISTISGLDGYHASRVIVMRENTLYQQSETQLEHEQSLEKQNLILRALQETTLDLHSSLDSEIVLHNIVERACKLLGARHGYLDMQRETGRLETVVGIGAMAESIKFKVVKGNGVSGVVWKTGTPLVVSDYDTWSGRVGGFPLGLIRSIVGMPLILKGQVVGVIGVARGFEENVVFSEDDVAVLKRFADLAAVALQNARLFEQAKRELEFRRKTEVELRNANQLLHLQIEKVELLQDQLRELAVRDSLTNLFNRRYLHEMLDAQFARAARSKTPLAVLMMDSDHLKDINDKYGHKAGDDFLIYISDIIRKSTHAEDIACRYGGDEFVIVLDNVTEEIALERAESLRESVLSPPIIHNGKKVDASISIGISMFPVHGSTGEVLLQKADLALYVAKRMGKNRVLAYTEGLE